jgi:hypothetical protein
MSLDGTRDIGSKRTVTAEFKSSVTQVSRSAANLGHPAKNLQIACRFPATPFD